MLAALNSGDLTRFCTAFDLLSAACFNNPLKYSFTPERV